MKKVFSLALALVVCILLTGCETFKTYTYTVENGDKVNIKIKTSGGYDLTTDVPFSIKKDDKTLSQGMFINLTGYETYMSKIKNDKKSKVIKSDSTDNIEYTFYSYNDEEWNYIIKVKDTETAILLGNPNSEKEAKECFEKIEISKK